MGLGLGKETAGMIVNREQIHLVENRLRVLAGLKIMVEALFGTSV